MLLWLCRWQGTVGVHDCTSAGRGSQAVVRVGHCQPEQIQCVVEQGCGSHGWWALIKYECNTLSNKKTPLFPLTHMSVHMKKFKGMWKCVQYCLCIDQFSEYPLFTNSYYFLNTNCIYKNFLMQVWMVTWRRYRSNSQPSDHCVKCYPVRSDS